MEEDKRKYLELIQGVITRLSQNSFSIRGWTITVISALLAFSIKDKVWPVAFIPATMFWWLDAYYLRQERLFRKLYDSVAKSNSTNITFSMDTSPFLKDVPNVLATGFTGSLVCTYLPIMLLLLFIYFLPKLNIEWRF